MKMTKLLSILLFCFMGLDLGAQNKFDKIVTQVQTLVNDKNWQQAKTLVDLFYASQSQKDSLQELDIVEKYEMEKLSLEVNEKVQKEEDLYSKIVRSNNKYDIEEYLNQYPYGKYSDDVYWYKVQNTNSLDAYHSYLEHFPTGKHATQAQMKYDQIIKDINDKYEFEKKQAEDKKRKEEEAQKNKLAEYERQRTEHNKKNFFSIGLQSGTYGKYGIVMENNENKFVGFRMAIRGSFIQGDLITGTSSIGSYYATNNTKTGQFGIELGPTFRVINFFHLYTCIGFGQRTYWTEYKSYFGTDTKFMYGVDDDDFGFHSSFGSIIRLGRVVNANIGVLLHNGADPELTYGISFNLSPKY